MKPPRYIPLRCHSAYSLLEGALKVDKLISCALEAEMPAIALCDTQNLFGALEFSQKASKAGLQPIVGCQLQVFMDETIAERKSYEAQVAKQFSSLVLIAMNEDGYRNLVRLVSASYLQIQDGDPAHITLAHLREHATGLICLSGGYKGAIDRALIDRQVNVATERLLTLQAIFSDRFYIEIQRHDLPHETRVEPELLSLAYDHNVPIVATNQSFFRVEDDFEAHDALMCIAAGTVVSSDERDRLTPAFHFRNQDEMVKVFSDLPEALQTSVDIAMRCSYRPLTIDPILPSFTGAKGDSAAALKAEADELRSQAVAGLKSRLDAHGTAHDLSVSDYEERLDYELSVIENMKFPGYFLIVADFIKWGKEQGIPVGPGRGSGAGSVVAWSLTITDLDPLRFSLLFERFLNPSRVSMPDFDIDFCQDRRDEVIRYVQERYGRDQVAQIITFGSLQARAVLRDVGRVLQMPYGQVDRLCKLVPSNPANPVTLAEAVEGEPKLQEARKEEEIVDQLITISLKLEGLFRHASTHAAGIVIGDRPLDQLVPLYRDARSDMPVTQFNMKWVESAGLVKFDFLGLKTLTVLQKALELLAKGGVDLNLETLPLDDEATYKMLSRGESVGVFQLESAGMRKALVGMRPDRFEDIIALVALYRPGPMDNIPIYNSVKHGEEQANYAHPKIEKYLSETNGVIIYQEQVMQIAQELSGYSLGEADLLRRAMGKKIHAEMEAQRVRFVDGAIERDVPKAKANEIFDLLAKFANYGFNKSHAAAYALVAYQTAYLKANYPVEFMAASMTLDMGNTDKLSDFKRDCARMDIAVEPPNINKSDIEFSVEDNTIFYALSALKGVGQQAVEAIIDERPDDGFHSLAELADTIHPKSLNKRTLESLVSSGAFDCLHDNRAELTAGLETIMARANRRLNERATGQNDMFSAAGDDEPLILPDKRDWLIEERLSKEHGAIGFYLSAHPLDQFADVLGKMGVQSWLAFSENVRKGATIGKVAATVVQKQERNARSGNRIGIVTLSDPTGQFEAVLFSEALAQYRDYLEVGNSLILIAAAEDRPEGINVRIQQLEPLERAAANFHGALSVFVRDKDALPSIKSCLPAENPKGGTISLIVLDEEEQREIELRLPRSYSLSPKIANAMRAMKGVVDVTLH